jgi:hypothetical protein
MCKGEKSTSAAVIKQYIRKYFILEAARYFNARASSEIHATIPFMGVACIKDNSIHEDPLQS